MSEQTTERAGAGLWDGRRVYDAGSGVYLGRAVGEPWSDGVEGFVSLRQDENGQPVKASVCCGFAVLDAPAR